MSPIEKKRAKSAQNLLAFESSLAAHKTRQEKIEALRKRMGEQHESRLEAFDPLEDDALHDDFSRKPHSYSLRDARAEELKKPIEESDRERSRKVSCT